MANGKFFQRIEWPTVGLIASTYLVVGGLVWFHAALPWWVILPVGAYFAALHSSLQHEVLHGHPTRSRLLNQALVFVIPNMWLPYGRYRDTHLQHHNDAYLTDPEKDPETYYMLPASWAALPGIKRMVYSFNNSLLGRMSIGPAVSIIRFWSADLGEALKGDRYRAACWVNFALSCAVVLAYVLWCGMPVWQYLLLIAYPSISLALVRSFCEHQAAPDYHHRTIIVEASPFWGLLFLHNNLHVAHHDRPALPWYEIPAYYRAEKARMVAQNGNYTMRGYGEIFRRYFFVAKERVPYPDLRWLKP
ncbi:MAG: fatty acid desaturase [Alphaproteobacteria bacterium]|nr:fatty acid desaturase [Alphaproteobacteria bacterium]